MLMKPIYFKSVKGRYGWRKIVQYHELRYDGTIKTIDPGRNSIRVNLSFGHPRKIELSTKEKFTKEIRKILDYKQNG